jgi:hypothetical protein
MDRETIQLPADLPPEAVRALAAGLDGALYLPGQPEYAVELDGFDRSVLHRPALVVAADSAADVVAAVRFAGRHRLGVAVQNTGHGVAVPADGAVFISTRRMTGYEVDAERATAVLAAGVLWREVIAAAAKHGLAPLNGSAPFVGAVSYILGGGLGVLSRRYGFAADHVRWIEVVTADGRLRRADPVTEPDLFWALRGGKGNFGVVTALEIDLVPVSRLYGGGLFYGAEATREVLSGYSRWVAGMPEEMSSSFAMFALPDQPDVPEPLRGRFVTHLRLACLGPAEEGRRLVQPLRDLAPTLLDTVTDMPYSGVASIHGDLPVAGSYYINTFQLTGLDHGTIFALLELAGPDSDGRIGIEIRHLGGALARPPTVPNAVAHRSAPFQLYSASVLGTGEDTEVRAAHAKLVHLLQPWNSSYRTLNFMAGIAHNDPAAVRAAYTDDAYQRLVEIKTGFDPDNMFRFNHNIPPASRAATGERP